MNPTDEALVERVARAIVGPHLPVAPGSQWTIENLRDIRWREHLNDGERNLALAQACAALEALPAEKGVGVKPLEWQEPTQLNNGCWTAKSILGTFSVCFEDGWYACLEDGARWEWEPENDPRCYEGPYAAQAACQTLLDTRIRSALLPASGAVASGGVEGLRAPTNYIMRSASSR